MRDLTFKSNRNFVFLEQILAYSQKQSSRFAARSECVRSILKGICDVRR